MSILFHGVLMCDRFQKCPRKWYVLIWTKCQKKTTWRWLFPVFNGICPWNIIKHLNHVVFIDRFPSVATAPWPQGHANPLVLSAAARRGPRRQSPGGPTAQGLQRRVASVGSEDVKKPPVGWKCSTCLLGGAKLCQVMPSSFLCCFGLHYLLPSARLHWTSLAVSPVACNLWVARIGSLNMLAFTPKNIVQPAVWTAKCLPKFLFIFGYGMLW